MGCNARKTNKQMGWVWVKLLSVPFLCRHRAMSSAVLIVLNIHITVLTECILNHSTRWRCVVSFTLWLLYPQGKIPQYPPNGRLVCPDLGEEWSLLSLPGISPCFLSSACTLMTIPAHLSWLQFLSYPPLYFYSGMTRQIYYTWKQWFQNWEFLWRKLVDYVHCCFTSD